MGFDIAVSNVFLTLLFILPGFLVCKAKKVRPEHQFSLSGLLIYACSPCLIVSTVISLEYSPFFLKSMALFFAATLLLQGSFIGILYLLFRRKYDDAKYRLLTVGSVLGNVGFFGLPIIRALLPGYPEVACYSAVFMITMNIFVFTVAVFCLTRDSKYVSPKEAVWNPSSISMVIGLVIYVLRIPLPGQITSALQALGSMTTPLCMLILGIRLASVPDLRKVFTRPFVYLICITKLLIFPIFSFAVISLFPVPDIFRYSILILCGTPDAAVLLSMAEMHHAEQELAANCVLLSTLLSVITIPLLTLLV